MPLFHEPVQRLNPSPPPHATKFQIERKVPLALMFTIAAQIIAVIVWATWLEARVASLEKARAAEADLVIRFVRVEERLESVRQEIELLRRQTPRH